MVGDLRSPVARSVSERRARRALLLPPAEQACRDREPPLPQFVLLESHGAAADDFWIALAKRKRGEGRLGLPPAFAAASGWCRARWQIGTELDEVLIEFVDLSFWGKQLHWSIVGPLFRAVGCVNSSPGNTRVRTDRYA